MLLKLLALGGLGYAGYKYLEKNQTKPAFAANQGNVAIRDAGPDAMRSDAPKGWNKTDLENDQSFPASDPPGNY